MVKSEDLKSLNLCQRILAIMKDLSYIQKGEKTVGGHYRFVSHDQVTAAIHPLLVKHGVIVVPSVENHKQEGNRTEIELKVSFYSTDSPNQVIGIQSLGYGIDSSDKGPGKAISYAYKYALLKMFCLETGDDSDNQQDAVYEPPECLQFDSQILADLETNETVEMNAYVAEISSATKKHKNDIEREAVKRKDDFMKAFKKWQKKKAT